MQEVSKSYQFIRKSKARGLPFSPRIACTHIIPFSVSMQKVGKYGHFLPISNALGLKLVVIIFVLMINFFWLSYLFTLPACFFIHLFFRFLIFLYLYLITYSLTYVFSSLRTCLLTFPISYKSNWNARCYPSINWQLARKWEVYFLKPIASFLKSQQLSAAMFFLNVYGTFNRCLPFQNPTNCLL